MRRYLKRLIKYLRFKKEINDYYGYALNEGYCYDETYNWEDKLDYWMRAQ
jgi:hypothetical protein